MQGDSTMSTVLTLPTLVRRFSVAIALMIISPAGALASPSGVMGPQDPPPVAAQMAPAANFMSDGKIVEMATFKGHPVMLWQVATWCGSCRAGLQIFEEQKALVDKSDMRIIVLRDYKNGGYPGISITAFAQQAAPSLLHDPHFIFGDDTEALYKLYNPQHYVDVYDLIGADGSIQVVSSAPSATFTKIQQFMTAQAKP
ncbi:MAG: hypothetical protein KGQ46_14295 [Hyphomicrobiales bacterium]|nr:hypothetical protein [Hyphomicrobiales bacterium]MDE2115940.1 hypothetical protein [Hyphomicrobiales bacterium]